MIHDIPLERRTLHGHFSRELEPILAIDPGDSIAFACPNAGWELDPGERFEPYDEELDAGHALIGPIEVRGAKAGRRSGGNIDCKELVAGTTLYLPISVDGALFSAGDGHGAQADGEASGTAIECPVERAQLTLELSDLELRSPIARTPDSCIAFGFDEDLDLAAEEAMATILDLMERERGLDRGYALALASLAVDLRVTQIVNGSKGVHAVLRD